MAFTPFFFKGGKLRVLPFGALTFWCSDYQFENFKVSKVSLLVACWGSFALKFWSKKFKNWCVLGFTPFSASLLFGLSLVALLIKHPELYPCWLRRVNCKIMFLYELFASLIFIEIGFCVWNSLETFLFYRIPSFLEEHCSQMGDLYIRIVETEVGVSLISNMLAFTLLLFTLHITRVCNFNLLLKTNGVHKFFADAGLTTKLCRHHRELRQYTKESSNVGINCPIPLSSCSPCRPCITPKIMSNRCPKMLRSGKKFY